MEFIMIQKHRNIIETIEKKLKPKQRYAHVIYYDEKNNKYVFPNNLPPRPTGVLCVPLPVSEAEWEMESEILDKSGKDIRTI